VVGNIGDQIIRFAGFESGSLRGDDFLVEGGCFSKARGSDKGKSRGSWEDSD